jgi:hypothetical protein
VSQLSEEPSLPLARRLAADLADAAETEISRPGPGLTVRVTPHRTGARPIDWTDFGDEIIVQVGDIGGRWELGPAPDDLAPAGSRRSSPIDARASGSPSATGQW